jgi:enamine deaminase RidA (YjgF/YER057c/UK114 family)
MMNPTEIKGGVDAVLARLGIVLPAAAAPVAAYVPTVEANGLLYVSGQLPFLNSAVMVGQLGEDVTLETGQAAARACGLMILAQIKAALGTLDRVERVVKLNVFVSSTARFSDHPKVANGASELMVDVFGEAGRHARAAVGVAALPLGAAVEVDAIVAVKPA